MGKRKTRYVDGVRLADHLYPDNQGRPGYWRYCRPDRSFKVFRARDVHEANAIAEDGNARRHLTQLDRSTMAYAVERYVAYAERIRPSLKRKDSWRNRCYAMRAFAQTFPVRTVTAKALWDWWDTLTHAQQILREAEFRRMWTWFLREHLVTTEINPFDQDRLLRREKPVSPRERLTLDGFWRIYHQAPAGIQVAMGISLVTTLRRGDVVRLHRRRHLQDGYLRVTVSKSEEQRGVLKAARLEWALEENPDLAALIERGLAASPPGCEFVVNLKPKVYRKTGKEHSWQVLPDRLTREYTRARIRAGVGGDHPPPFHEIRSLASKLLADQGAEITDVMELLAHSDVEMTKLYQSGHPLPFTRVRTRLTDVGGKW